MLIRITAIVACLAMAYGQATLAESEDVAFFSASYEVSLSSAAGAFTIQLPAGSKKRLYLKAGSIYCSVACSITQDKNGTAATATAISPLVALNGSSTPLGAAYGASDAGTGSALPKIYLAAGETKSMDLTYTNMTRNAAAAQNYNIRVGAITGTFSVAVIWGEK